MGVFKNPIAWLYSLFATAIGGAAGAFASGLGSMLIDPKDFNLQDGLGKTLQLMGICAVFHGGLNLATYLKQSPLPPLNTDTTTITKTETLTVKTAPAPVEDKTV